MSKTTDYRNRVKSIYIIGQTTRAMQLIASVKLAQLKGGMDIVKKASENWIKIVSSLIKRSQNGDFDCPLLKNLLDMNKKKKLNILFTSDQGLCGSFNTSIFRRLNHYISKNNIQDDKFILIGKKCMKYFKNNNLDHLVIQLYNKEQFSTAKLIANLMQNILKYYKTHRVQLIFNECKSILVQTPKISDIFDLNQYQNIPTEVNHELNSKNISIIVENILLSYLNSVLYKIILHSKLSEESARLQAMDSANRNVEKLINDLTLKINRIRQNSITQEITEIVNSVESFS